MSALFAKIKQPPGTEKHHNKEMACDLKNIARTIPYLMYQTKMVYRDVVVQFCF